MKTKFIKIACFLLILGFTVTLYFHSDMAMTQDLGRHLTLGKIIWTTKSIPKTNLFSYTYPDFPFLNHHWGSEVIYYLLFNVWGINGLICLNVFLSVLTIGIIGWRTVYRTSPLPFLTGGILALSIIRERTDIRPEMFGNLLFAATLFILYWEREKKTKLLYLIPIISLLWVNLHISFIYDSVLYFLFISERILLKRLQKRHIWIGLLLIIAILINPAGIAGALYPLRIFQNYGYPVAENQTVSFLSNVLADPVIAYYKLAVFIVALILPFLLLKQQYFQIATVLLTGILSYMAIRNFPFFALALFYPVADGLDMIWKMITEKMPVMKEKMKLVQIFVTAVLILFILQQSLSLISNKYYFQHGSPLRSGFGEVPGAAAAVDFYLSHHLSEPIFNNFDIGSYLTYRLYPNERVFVDGRPEAYPVSFFKDTYIPMQENVELFKKLSRQYEFNTIIFNHTVATPWGRTFLQNIIHDPDWALVYFDTDEVIIVSKKSLPENIFVYDTTEKRKTYGLTLIIKEDQPDSLLRLANFFNLIDLPDLSAVASGKAQRYR
jgi:hypothetical protein